MEALLGHRVRVPPEEWGLKDGNFWGVIVLLGIDTSGNKCVGVQLEGGELFHWPTEMVIQWLLGQLPALKRPRLGLPEPGFANAAGQPAQACAEANAAVSAHALEAEQRDVYRRSSPDDPSSSTVSLPAAAGSSQNGQALQGQGVGSGHNATAAAARRQQSCGDMMVLRAADACSGVQAASTPLKPSDSTTLFGPPSKSRTQGQAVCDGRQQAGVAVVNCRLAQIQKLRALERWGRDSGGATGPRCLGLVPKLAPGSSGQRGGCGDGTEAPATGGGGASPVPSGASLLKSVVCLLESAGAPFEQHRQEGAGSDDAGGRTAEGPAVHPEATGGCSSTSTIAAAGTAPGAATSSPQPQLPLSDERPLPPGKHGESQAGADEGALASCATAAQRDSPGIVRGLNACSVGRKRRVSDDEGHDMARYPNPVGLRSAGAQNENDEGHRPAGLPHSARVEHAAAAPAEQQGVSSCGSVERVALERLTTARRIAANIKAGESGVPPQSFQPSTALGKPRLSPIQAQVPAPPALAERRFQELLLKPSRGTVGAVTGVGGGAGPPAVHAVAYPKNGAAALAAGIPLGCYIY